MLVCLMEYPQEEAAGENGDDRKTPLYVLNFCTGKKVDQKDI